MRVPITILAVAALAACAPTDAQNTTRGLALDLQPSPAGPGEEISLVLRNGSSAELGYDLCTSRLTHQRDGHWVLADSRRNCDGERQTLQPGAESAYDIELPAELDGGSYRFTMRVEVGGSRIQEIYSPAFQIPEAAPVADEEGEDAQLERPLNSASRAVFAARSRSLTSAQIRFIEMVIDHLAVRGVIKPGVLL